MPRFPLWKTILVFAVILLFAYFAIPSFVSPEKRHQLPTAMQGNAINLGLDLRGGSHLLLQVDFPTYFREQVENLRGEVRQVLRDTKTHYRDVAIDGNAIRFSLIDGDLEPFRRRMGADFDISESNGQVSIAWSERALKVKRQQLIDQSIEIVERRVNDSGTKEPLIQRQGDDRIVVQVPGLDNPEELKKYIGKTAKMTFHLVAENIGQDQVNAGNLPFGVDALPLERSDGQALKIPVMHQIELSGEMLTGSSVNFQYGQPVVSFQFNQAGAQKFAQITQANVGRRFAVVLDDKVITAPSINGPIPGGSGIIEGHFTVESANELALLLRSGALPAPLKVIEERSVGPSLGADSIADGTRASIVGLLGVVVFMILGYGLFGVFSIVALLCNIILVIGALGLFQATLTLPGIAGIVLTFGMAVDANVLIYERIREEVAKGRSPISAVESGFKLAFATIVDAHMTSLIAAAILYELGTGTIRGFAVTLAIGIVASLFTAILVTRMQVAAWFRLSRPKTLPL